jgi:aminotransferase
LIRAGVARHVPSIRKLLGDGVDYLKYYNSRILASPNVELKATRAMLDDSRENLVDLSLGAPEIDPALATFRPLERKRLSGYPSVAGDADLRQAVAIKLHRENALQVDPEDEVLVTTGVSQAIGLVLDTFVDVGEKVALFDPSFFIYRLAAQNRRAKVSFIPSHTEEGLTRFDEKALAKTLRGARLLMINSPANPTGGVLDQEALERIAFWCRKRDVLIFSDEVYERFQYEGRPCSIGSLPDAHRRTITANSFSKSHGLAAIRVGYVAGYKHLIQPMIVSSLATAPFVSAAAQQCARHALEHPTSTFQPTLAKYRARRDLVARTLRTLELPFDPPGGAFYFWIHVQPKGCTGADFAARLLEEQQVRLLSGDASGPSGKGWIRLSYACGDRDLQEGLRRLTLFVAGTSPATIPMPTRRYVRPRQRRSA